MLQPKKTATWCYTQNQLIMSTGQLQNLQRLERLYLQALSQNGFESPVVVQAAVDFANTLLRDGTNILKTGVTAQAEIYFIKAKEVLTPITIQSGIYYSTSFLKARGQTMLKLVNMYEKQKNYTKAWANLKEALPHFEKFAITKRQNLSDEEVSVLKLYNTLLHHGAECCRLIKRKEEMLDLSTKLIDISQRLGYTYEALNKLSKDEFQEKYLKWYSMLCRAFYQIGKSQFKVGFERQALRNLYKASQISELVFGPDDIKSVKCRDKYEKLCQKLEFEAILNQEQIDFTKFKQELHQEALNDQIKMFTPKPNQNFDQHILQQVKSYQQIVSQLSNHSSRYQMPEYVKKVREDYESKLRGMSDSKQTTNTQFSQYIIKRKPNMSRATSQYINAQGGQEPRIFSPRLSMAAAQSHKVSLYQNLLDDKMDQLKVHLQETELQKTQVTDLLIQRPQPKSEHIRIRAKVNSSSEMEKAHPKGPNLRSQRMIIKPQRQPTQVIKTESQTSEQQLKFKHQSAQETHQENLESSDAMKLMSNVKDSPHITPMNIFQNVKTEFSDQPQEQVSEFKMRQSQSLINEAVVKIQQWFRRRQRQKRVKLKTLSNLPSSLSMATDKQENSNKNSMKVSIKESMLMKQSLRRTGQQINLSGLVTNIRMHKIESEQSITKAKRLIEILVDFHRLMPQQLHFVEKLFFDVHPQFWTLRNIQLKVNSPRSSRFGTQTDEMIETQEEDLRLQIMNIHSVFSDPNQAKQLQLLVGMNIHNSSGQSYTFNLVINNFISNLDEFQKWFFKDQLQMLDEMLTLYCKQQNVQIKKNFKNLVIYQNESIENISEQIIAKLVYLLKNHFFLVKKQVGFKLVSEKCVQEKELQNEIIDYSTIQRNFCTQQYNKRLSRLLMNALENIRFFELNAYTQQFSNQSEVPQNSIQILESEQEQDEDKEEENPELILSFKHSSLHEYGIIHSTLNFPYDVINEPQERKTHDSRLVVRQKPRQQTSIQPLNPAPKPFIIPSSTNIKPQTPSPQSARPAIASSFANYFVGGGKAAQIISEKSQSQSHSLYTAQELEFLRENFPDFRLAPIEQLTDYQPGEVHEIVLQTRPFKDIHYFRPQGKIIRPDPLQFEDEYPPKFILLTYCVKQGREIGLVNLILNDQRLYIQTEGDEQQLDVPFYGRRLPTRAEKLSLLEMLYDHQTEVIEEPPHSMTKIQLIQTLAEAKHVRYVAVIISRIVPRLFHYNEDLRMEMYDLLRGNITSHNCQNDLIFSGNTVKLAFQKLDEEDEEEISPIPLITMNLVPTDLELNKPTVADSFDSFNTQFTITENKYFSTYKAQGLFNYVKFELNLKQQQERDTKIAYLRDQQAREEVVYLKKALKKLVQENQVSAKIRIYNANTRISLNKYLTSNRDLEKILHLLTHRRKPIFPYLFKFAIVRENRMIGNGFYLGDKQQYDRDKYSELDQFLFLYISDPTKFNDGNHSDSRLKQTLLFYFFKQQLKLTLISSSHDRFFMKTYFRQKHFYAQTQYSIISGQVFVELRVYQFNQFYRSEVYTALNSDQVSRTFFYFQISPQNVRTKLFKLIMDISDINSLLFPQVSEANCFQDKVLHEVVQKLTSFLVCFRTNTYNSLKIPLSYVCPSSKYELLNTFREVTFGSNILMNSINEKSPILRQKKSHPKLSIIITGTDDKKNYERKKSKSSELDRIFQIESLAFPREAGQILKNTTMLTPIYKGQKIIYKCTKVIQKSYVIITVSYNMLGSFQVSFYIPQTCRNFSTILRQCDFANMDPMFLESIFPSQFVTKELIDEFFLNRWKFNEINRIYNMAMNHPDDFEEFFSEIKSQARAIPHQEYRKLTESKISIKEEEDLFQEQGLMLYLNDDSKANSSDSQRVTFRASTQPPIFLKKQFTKQSSTLSMAVKKNTQLQVPGYSKYHHQSDQKSMFYRNSPRPSNSSLELSSYIQDANLFYNTLLVRKNNFDIIANFELKIWEQLINKISIVKNPQGRFIMGLGTFKGVLKECLFSQTVYLGCEVNAFYEVYIENKKAPQDMFKPFLPLRLSQTNQHSMYQRITFLDKPQVMNIKMMLRKTLYQYHTDERLHLQNIQLRNSQLHSYEFILSDLQQCAVYMLNRLKKNFMQTSTCQLQDFAGDQKCPQVLKLNVSNQMQEMLVKRNYEYTLLIRRPFTGKSMISIFYRAKSQRFYINIWDTCTNQQLTIKRKLEEIQERIPNTTSLLQLGLNLELGHRIFLSQKNKLLIQTYQSLTK